MASKVLTKLKVRKGIGPLGSKLLSELSSGMKEIFAVKEAEAALGIRGPRLRKLLFDLMKNRWIERIERGKYLINPLESGWNGTYSIQPFEVARSLVSPYYVGFVSALNYYGITEQVSRTTFIASPKRKLPFRFHAQDYRFVLLSKKRFFGFSQEWTGNYKFNISDKEKTVVDCMFLPKYSGGLTEVVKAFREKLDYEKLYDYALRLEDLATIKRLGFVLDVLKIKTRVVEKLLKKVAGGYCLLDTGGPKTGSKNAKWRVIENIPGKELEAEL